MNENQNEMTSEQLDEIETELQVYRDGEKSYIAPKRHSQERLKGRLLARLPELIALARQGLQLREAMDSDNVTKAQLIVEEINGLKEFNDKAYLINKALEKQISTLTAELEALRKDKERLDWLEWFSALAKSTAVFNELFGSPLWNIRTAIDSAMEKEKSV